MLSAEVGLDSLFFTKYDYQDHQIRHDTKRLEFIWRASPSLGSSAQVFVHTFPGLGDYGPPPGMCFDISCGDQPVQDDPRLEDDNLKYMVDLFVQNALDQAAVTAGDINYYEYNVVNG